MAADGSVFKWCNCKNSDGKRIGVKCPQLRRADGAWHPTHGTWAYQLELPRDRDGKRRPLRRVPYGDRNTRDAAADERDHARALLHLAAGDDNAAEEIATLLKQTPAGHPLPDQDAVARRLRAGVPLSSSDLTTGEYLARWITRRRMDESTRRTYAGHIRNHLVPHLGHIRLHQLRIDHIAVMFAKIAARNEQITAARRSDDPHVRASVKGQRTVGLSTMHRIRATLRKALNDAIRKERLIDHNPASHFELEPDELPKARLWTDAAVKQWRATGHVPSKVMVWTPDQAGVFLDYTEEHDPDLYPLFAFVLRRGPRRGEAVGIRTDQIDLATATAVISHQIATLGYEPVYKKVKTRQGDRIVALDSDTVADLTAYSKRRAAHKLAAGPDWPDTIQLRTPAPGGGTAYVDVDLFFRRPDGTAWHPELVSERFERHARDAGLPPVGIHDGRHGAATFTKAAGGDITEIKELLGHSTITITADIYTSLLQDLQRVTAENTAKLIPRKRRNTAA